MAQQPSSTKTVLVVDDEPDLRAVMREILHDEGYAVLEAPHGGVLLEILTRVRVDLVLMDVIMPGGDGRAAYRELRARPEFADLPVVMMSAAVPSEMLDPSLAAFLRKPFELDGLLSLVLCLIGPPHEPLPT